MKKYLLFLIGLFLLSPVMAQTEDDSDDTEMVEANNESTSEIDTKVVLHRYKMGDGIRLTTQGGNRFVISGMVQTSVESRRFEDVEQMYNRFRMRRARVRFDGSVFHDKMRFRLGLDLVKGSETDDASGSLLMDAWMAYRPWGSKLVVSFGQRSTPTDNYELQMSSHTLQFGERSKITSAFSTIRELGVFAEGSYRAGSIGLLRPSIAITDGAGPISDGKRYGGLKYGARLNYLPFGTFRAMGGSREGDMAYELTPKLNVGIAYSYTDGTSDRRGGRSNGDILYMNDRDEIDLPDYAKFVADFHFKYRGFSVLGEYAKTWGYVPSSITKRVRNDGSTATTFDVDGEQNVEAYIKNRMMLGQGFNIQTGYMLRSLWSFDLRYTHLKPDEYSYMNNNLYFNRHNFYDFSVSKYLTRNYAAKIQFTIGLARSNGENRTPDSAHTYNGNEWIGNLLFQFKF